MLRQLTTVEMSVALCHYLLVGGVCSSFELKCIASAARVRI